MHIGNGTYDDTNYLQELLDSGKRHVYFPQPEVCYTISRPLLIHSNTSLVLDRFTEIKLKAGSDCIMLKNADDRSGNENISVSGGIWNFNNKEQAPNPICTNEGREPFMLPNKSEYFSDLYLGVALRFSHVKNLTLKALTVKDPATFGIQIGFVEYFTISDITFDYNLGNPIALNMDGVHLDGGCRYGHIENVKGTTHDDLVAINADDFASGPISDITVNGVYSESCHSAVRLLSVHYPVKNISVSNVYGSFYRYAICISKFYETEEVRGSFSNLVFKNIAVSKAPLLPKYGVGKWITCAPLHIGENVDIDVLSVENLSRHETVSPVESIYVGENTNIGVLSARDCVQHNLLNHSDYVKGVGYKDDINELRERNKDTNDMPFLVNKGTIRHLNFAGINTEETLLINDGTIHNQTVSY
ncbi:MAG: hypothetical protein IJC78_02495 [Clostridia bacterium]|nr:hypothetical protein [Clostridia bacterium]